MASVFTLEKTGAVASICFDDGKINVLALAETRELRRIFIELDADQQIKCVILRGNVRIFSAGLDLHTIREGGEEAFALLDAMRQLLLTLYGSRVRIICICSGHAVAAGALLLLVSDYRIGVSGTVKVGFSEVLFGLPFTELPLLLVKDRISVDQQFPATVLGKMFDSAEAQKAGFLDELAVNLQEAQDKATRVANKLVELDETAYLETLRNVRGPTLARLQKG